MIHETESLPRASKPTGARLASSKDKPCQLDLRLTKIVTLGRSRLQGQRLAAALDAGVSAFASPKSSTLTVPSRQPLTPHQNRLVF